MGLFNRVRLGINNINPLSKKKTDPLNPQTLPLIPARNDQDIINLARVRKQTELDLANAKELLKPKPRLIKENQKDYKNNSLTPTANSKRSIRYGWGIANVRKSSFLSKSADTNKWKFFRFTYRTKNQLIGAAALQGMTSGDRQTLRKAHSRALPSDLFVKKHRKGPERKPSEHIIKIEDKLTEINHLDGGYYQNKLVETTSAFIDFDNSTNPGVQLTEELSTISDLLDKKLKLATATTEKTTNPAIEPAKPLAVNYMLMLTHAIQSTCGEQFIAAGANPSDKFSQATIITALNHLTSLPLLGSLIATPPAPAAQAALPLTGDQPVMLAWRIAYKLAGTSTGFDLLKKINTSNENEDYTNPQKIEPPLAKEQLASLKRKNLRRDESLRLFLQGADAFLKEEKEENLTGPQSALTKLDPASLLEYCRHPDRLNERRPNRILIGALPALQVALARNEDITLDPTTASAAAITWQDKVTAILNAHPDVPMWSANALRNGFFSDAPGKPFQKVNARLEKVSLQVTRGLKNQGSANPEAMSANPDPMIANCQAATEDNYKPILSRMFKRNRGKTPFNGSMPISIATNGALLQREKMTAALQLLERMLYRNLPDGLREEPPNFNIKGSYFENNLPSLPENQVLLKKIAIITHLRLWASAPQAEVLDGRPLSENIVRTITSDENDKYLNKLLNFIPTPGVADSERITNCKKGIIRLFKDEAVKPLQLSLLGNLFAEYNAEGNYPVVNIDDPSNEAYEKIPNKVNIEAMSDDELRLEFEKAKRHLENGRDDADKITDLNPGTTNTREAIGSYLNKHAQRMRLGSSVKFSDGSTIGIGMQGLTAVVARIFMGGVFGIRANFSSRRSRLATAEFGVNAAGGFARFGTETNHTNRAGAGGSIGWSFAKFRQTLAGVGAYADGKGIYDPAKFTGVTLRLDRLGENVTGEENQIAGVAGDANMTKKLGTTIQKVIHGKQVGEGRGSLLQQLLEDEPRLSVSWLDDGDSTTRDVGHIEQAGVVAGAYAGGVGLGAGLSVSRTRRHQKQHYQEQTGALKSRVIGRTERTTINGQATAIGLVNLGTVSAQAVVANETVAVADIMGRDVEIFRHGTREEIRTVELNGRLQPRTYKLIVHANAEAFATKVEQNIQEWGQRFVQVKEPDNYCYVETADAERKARMKTATEEQAGVVRDMILHIRETAHPNTAYIEYLELSEASTIAYNRYRDMAKTAESTGERGVEAKELGEYAEYLLNDPASYVPRFLFTTATQAADDGFAINFVGSYSTLNRSEQTVMIDGFRGA